MISFRDFSETGHLVRDCHYRIQNQEQAPNTSEEQSSCTTTDGIRFLQNIKSPADTEEPDPTPAESLQPRHQQPRHQQPQNSTPSAKQYEKGNVTKQPIIDQFDGSIIESTLPQGDNATLHSNRENKLQRQKSTKRRERTPNNSSDEKPPQQRQNEDEESETDLTESEDASTVFNSLNPEGMITCECSK